MKANNILAERIRQSRMQKGYSQEHLAETANISIRTLQRIEGGQTQPQGHTLMALAQALDVAIEDLMDFTKRNDRSILHLINLSALAYFVLPLGNIILPLIIWIIYRDKVEGVNRFGKRQVFIQIGWTIFMCFLLPVLILYPYSNWLPFALQIKDWLVLEPTLPLTSVILIMAVGYFTNAIYIFTLVYLIKKDKHIPFLGLSK